ncbi:energy transducer TonB [Roseivirga sp.]|uniref:energy transducer TonB n=1 Tax=Roseivirga sp. TaxID=1964215 RepID=UPI003B51D442
MKKSTTLLLLLLVIAACDKSELYIEPGQEMSVAIQETPDATSIDQVFVVTEEQPEYPGGQQGWFRHLGSNLKYPEQAKAKGTEGAVFLSFVVDKTGELRDLQVVRGIGDGCDEEALRVLMESENWIPAKQRGKEVSARMQVRILFKLSEANAGPSTINHETKPVEIIEVPDNSTGLSK